MSQKSKSIGHYRKPKLAPVFSTPKLESTFKKFGSKKSAPPKIGMVSFKKPKKIVRKP